jgi:diaminopimelate decarboxylase
MEYDLALKVGVMPQRIIFNGPYKSESDIEKALLAGSVVNLDSFYEVMIVEAIAQRMPECTINVGLRCNFDIGTENISRFGFDVEGAELKCAFEILSNIENCRINGLHCHFSTGHRSVESYALRTKKMLELSAFYFGGNHPRFVNLGGGYFSKMDLDYQKQFPFPIPTYQEYAVAIAGQFSEIFHNDSRPELIVEPGSALTANIMDFVAKVIDIKTVRSRTIALTSGSIHNIKPTLHNKNLPMQVINNTELNSKEISETIDIVGYTCMEHDCLYRGYHGSISAGDYAIFNNVGAYTIVMKPPFIRPSPSIIAYDPATRKFEMIKRQETFTDVFSTYIF